VGKENCNISQPLQGYVKLDNQCTYDGDMIISKSDTILDCDNALINAANHRDGIVISSEGKVLSNVIIKNCKIENAKESGIRTSWLGKDTNKSGEPDRYLRTPHNIRIEKVVITNSGKNGIFIDDYSSYVEVHDSIIKGSGATAIYIEHDSKNNLIDGNLLEANGFVNGRPKREGLAIDSSQKNVISNNKFIGNGLGGVFIYKNCSERISSGNQEIRKMHSNFNIIKDNKFEDEKVGIWLASRQNK
ncbi:TPA: right-handed parallel beta-helix repeat-containing protein, partial [Enterobacter roggenkampii]|nr:right-handed parallel beta-helix repeat-containing protein [Enterobacter roggenkampii]